MSHLKWPTDHPDAPKNKQEFSHRTPDYQRPYRTRADAVYGRELREIVDPEQPPAEPRAGLRRLIASAAVLLLLGSIAVFILTSWVDETTVSAEPIPTKFTAAKINGLEIFDDKESATDYLSRVKISSFRQAADQSRVMIDGEVFRVGDVVNEEIGLVFIGHDPDGEYLLFQDAEKETHFITLSG